MTDKGVILIDGKEYVTIRTYLSMPECPWSHIRTVGDKIREEGFPAVRRGKFWLVCLKEANLWFKRRDKTAS